MLWSSIKLLLPKMSTFQSKSQFSCLWILTSKYLKVILNELIISTTLLLSASFGQLLSDNYLSTNGTFKVGKFYFYSRVLFVTQNFTRSCVIHSNFFPTHSYMFFQWKTFQMRIQDFRFFIPPKLRVCGEVSLSFKTF